MNFLDIQPGGNNDRSNSWRNAFAIGLLLLVLGGAGWSMGRFYTTGSVSSFLEKVSPAGFPFAADKAVVRAGGDIMVEPVFVPDPPTLIGELPPASTFAAEGLLVKDVASGKVLYEKGAYTERPIASITKLMSALVILERNPDWATSTIVIDDDTIPDTHMYGGDVYTLEELWRAALIGSSNKAIITLADAVSWPRAAFVERMNQKAHELGMQHTVFTDPSGLDAGNMSTPSDLALLLAEALSHEEIQVTLLMPEHEIYSTVKQQDHHMWSTNWLLLGWIPSTFDMLGGKTGYIPESGYNFISRIRDLQGHELDIIVLGTAAHEDRFTVLRDAGVWAYENHEWHDTSSLVSSTESGLSPLGE